jgi:hypothetical protein
MRWGSQEARVEKIELLDAAGQPTKLVRTGDTVIFRFHYAADESIERPVFGMAILSLDGVWVTGPNTREADLVPDHINREGFVDLRVDRLLLLPGAYDVSASIVNYTFAHVYDYRHRALRFDVEVGQPREEHGIVSVGGEWEANPALRID